MYHIKNRQTRGEFGATVFSLIRKKTKIDSGESGNVIGGVGCDRENGDIVHPGEPGELYSRGKIAGGAD